MPETRIIHFRDWDRDDPNSVYIGRAVPRKGLKASPWANPFRIRVGLLGVSEAETRRESIGSFGTWVHYSHDPRAAWIRAHVHELQGKTLVCWCKPDYPCHGDVLKEMADAS